MALTKSEIADLKRAKMLLENPGIAAKLSTMVGSPVEKGMKMLPARWQKGVHTATEAAKHLTQKGVGKSGAPALVRLVSLIAGRFGIVVSEKAAAQAIPIIGAAGGALINTIFIGHYQDMARGHFIVRRLEKIHGADPVRLAYEAL